MTTIIRISNGQTYDQPLVSGEVLYVSSGGEAEGVVVGNGAEEYVFSSGLASAGGVASGGKEYVFGTGTVDSEVVSNGGYLSANGLVENSTVAGGGYAEIAFGGTTSGVVIDSGGTLYDNLAGTTVGDTVLSGGSEIVDGVASGATVEAGGYFVVSDFGSAFSTTVENGGTLIKFPHTTVLDTTGSVQSGGVVVLSTGVVTATTGTLSGNTVALGESEYVLSGGIASNVSVAAITSGLAELFVYSGGSLSGGSLGGVVQLFAGGSASGATVTSDGSLSDVAGRDTEIEVAADGLLSVGSGGFSADALIDSAGIAEVAYSGVASGITIDAGGTLLISRGFASGGTVASGGFAVVSAGGVFNGVTILPGGHVVVPTIGVVGGNVGGGTIQYGGVVVSSGHAVISAAPTLSDNTLTGSGFSLGFLGDTEAEYVYQGGLASSAVVEAGGGLYVSSGGSASGNTLISGGAELVASGGVVTSDVVSTGGGSYVAASGSALGFTLSSGGFQYVSAGAVVSGTLISNGGTQEVAGIAMVSSTVLSGGLEVLYATSGVTDLVDQGGEIFFPNPYQPGFSASVTGGNVLELLSGGAVLDSVQLLGGSDTTYAVGSGSYSRPYTTYSGTVLEGVACYCPGTRITTPDGTVPIETLRIGDSVVTVSEGRRARTIRWIGRRSYAPRFARRNPDVWPVTIAAGALGGGLPRRDLSVSPRHAMVLNGMLVPAIALCNGTTIRQRLPDGPIDYLHLELETHDLLLAEGSPSESFVDDDSRMLFHNADEFAALYPHHVTKPALYCAPLVEHGYALASIKARLAS